MTIDLTFTDEVIEQIKDTPFAVAEATLNDVPPRQRGPQSEGTPSVDEMLEAVSARYAAVGIEYAPITLAKMRKVAAWAAGNRTLEGAIEWVDTTWKEHLDAFEKGIRFEEFAAGQRANPVGRTLTENRRQTLLDAAQSAIAAGEGGQMKTGAKVLDVAANPSAMSIAIENDPATLAVAREAVGKADLKATREAIVKAGGNPDLIDSDPRTTIGLDALGLDALKLRDRYLSTIGEVRRLHERAEDDQWPRLAAIIREGVDKVLAELTTADAFPDTIPENMFES